MFEWQKVLYYQLKKLQQQFLLSTFIYSFEYLLRCFTDLVNIKIYIFLILNEFL